MPSVHLKCPPSERFVAGFDRIRQEFQISQTFPSEVAEAARHAALTSIEDSRSDRRDLAVVTIDPEGSMDLDQAFSAERRGSGYRVHYAIADVALFVRAGDPLDVEARNRGVTFYAPDAKASLHPEVVSQGAASLLPGVDRPALLWTIDLDESGAVTEAHVARSIVRSRRAVSYHQVTQDLDSSSPSELFVLLREIGLRRLEQEVARGGVSLNLPGQEVVEVTNHYELHYRVTEPVEDWNAQISLMTGMAAARIMLDGGVGLLRVLAPPDEATLGWLRRTSRALGVAYGDDTTYGDWVRSLDASEPAQAALLNRAASAFRGAGYLGFEGVPPTDAEHSAIASPYAHVTAPLRRLIDRFANEIVLRLCADEAPPAWVVDALDEIPDAMTEAHRHGRRFEKALVDFAEAMVLSNHIGERFTAVVTGQRSGKLTLQVRESAVITTVRETGPGLGDVVDVKLTGVDPEARRVEFEVI